MSTLTRRLECRKSRQICFSLQVQRKAGCRIPLGLYFKGRRTTAWINTTSHCSLLRKFRILLHLLGNVVTLVGSVHSTGMAHLVIRFLSTVYLDAVANRPLHHRQTGIAVYHHAGTDFPQLHTRRRCCRFLVPSWQGVIDHQIRLSLSDIYRFERLERVQVELVCSLADETCGIDSHPPLLVTLRLAPITLV